MRKKVSSVHFCLRQRHPSTSVILSDTEGASAVRAAQDYFLLQVAASIGGVEQAFMPAVGTFPPCHSERTRGSGATKRESRNPENASSAMLSQGVLTRNRPCHSEAEHL